MKYIFVYTGNTINGFAANTNSRDALKHLVDNFISAGNDTVTVYKAAAYAAWNGNPNTAPIVSQARYTPEYGGKFYRCHI